MKKYRHLPTEVEAQKYTGAIPWGEPLPFEGGLTEAEFRIGPVTDGFHAPLQLKTLEGWMNLSIGDWVIKGPDSFWVNKPDYFAQNYKPVDDVQETG